MQLKALITTLVLGSSSVAMAHPISAPGPVSAPAPVPAPIVRDHRMPVEPDCDPGQAPAMPAPAPVAQPVWQPMPPQPAPGYERPYYRSGWIMLGGVDRITAGPTTFRVGRFGKQLSTLKLEGEGRKSLIQRVLIQFANGRTQVVEVNQYLTASNPTIEIDLQGRTRAVSKVTVYSRNARQSAYRVLAI